MFFTDVTSHDRESCIKSIQATFVDTGSGGYKNLKSQCPVAVSWSAAAATESQSRQQKYVNQKTVIETITVLPITLTLLLVVSKGFINMITVRNRKPRIDIGIFFIISGSLSRTST